MPLGRRRNRIERSLRERGVPPEPQHREREVQATSGPWDVADSPDDGMPRVDLGAIQLPAHARHRPPRRDRPAAADRARVSLRAGDSQLQVAVFAAPARRRHLGRHPRRPRQERVRPGRVAARGRRPVRPGAGRHDHGGGRAGAGAGAAPAGPPAGPVPGGRRPAVVPAGHPQRPGGAPSAGGRPARSSRRRSGRSSSSGGPTPCRCGTSCRSPSRRMWPASWPVNRPAGGRGRAVPWTRDRDRIRRAHGGCRARCSASPPTTTRSTPRNCAPVRSAPAANP